MYKTIQGNDITINWQIKAGDIIIDFTDLSAVVYICDSIGKRVANNVVKDDTGLHFDFLANNQFAGVVRLEVVWVTSNNITKRKIADNVIDYINDPENVDGDIDTIDIITTAYKSAITYS